MPDYTQMSTDIIEKKLKTDITLTENEKGLLRQIIKDRWQNKRNTYYKLSSEEAYTQLLSETYTNDEEFEWLVQRLGHNHYQQYLDKIKDSAIPERQKESLKKQWMFIQEFYYNQADLDYNDVFDSWKILSKLYSKVNRIQNDIYHYRETNPPSVKFPRWPYITTIIVSIFGTVFIYLLLSGVIWGAAPNFDSIIELFFGVLFIVIILFVLPCLLLTTICAKISQVHKVKKLLKLSDQELYKDDFYYQQLKKRLSEYEEDTKRAEEKFSATIQLLTYLVNYRNIRIADKKYENCEIRVMLANCLISFDYWRNNFSQYLNDSLIEGLSKSYRKYLQLE